MRILIAGSGALGLYYGGRWQEKGHEVFFWARGENARVLKEKGLYLESIEGDLVLPRVRVVEGVPEIPTDLVVLTVKAYDTEVVLPQLSRAVTEHTLILSLQNGVDNEEKIALAYGAERTVGGVAFIGAERVAPGRVRHSAAGHVTIGPWSREQGERVRHLAEELTTPKVTVNYHEEIRYDLWLKLLWNAAFNTTTCLAGTPAHVLLKTPEGEELIRNLMEEVMAVARAEGVELPREAMENYITVTRTMGEVRTSMLVDREQHRPLEVEAISGVVVRKGKEHGIPVPLQSVLYTLLSSYQNQILSSSP